MQYKKCRHPVCLMLKGFNASLCRGTSLKLYAQMNWGNFCFTSHCCIVSSLLWRRLLALNCLFFHNVLIYEFLNASWHFNCLLNHLSSDTICHDVAFWIYSVWSHWSNKWMGFFTGLSESLSVKIMWQQSQMGKPVMYKWWIRLIEFVFVITLAQL